MSFNTRRRTHSSELPRDNKFTNKQMCTTQHVNLGRRTTTRANVCMDSRAIDHLFTITWISGLRCHL